MYLDDRPVSTFQPTAGWNMATANSEDRLKRPPMIKAGPSSSSSVDPRSRPPRPPLSSNSSSSSLRGLEQNVPSFQAFIRQTPAVDLERNKPLPPTPVEPQRSFNSLKDALNRRSSSVYSRTPSQLPPQLMRWESQDPEDDSPILLRSMRYSASTPHLASSDVSVPQLLEARTFAPLIESPRATTVASNSPLRSRSHSMLTSLPFAAAPLTPTTPTTFLPPTDTDVKPARAVLTSPVAHFGARKPVHTVSLAKAKEAMNAPGATRLLPEELRAQALMRKGRSPGHVRLESIDIFGGADKTPLPPSIPTMIDNQGRARSMRTPSGSETPRSVRSFQSSGISESSSAYFPVGTGPVREMAPPPFDDASQSRVSLRQLSRDSEEGSRGRRKERASYQQDTGKSSSDIAMRDMEPDSKIDETQNLAKEYHSLLGQHQYRQASQSPEYSSDESIRTHMKMVPQPLFRTTKQPPKSRGPGSSLSNDSSVSPFDNHRRGRSDGSASSGRRSTGFGLHLSLDPPKSKTRHSSTTGMIPISPPTDMEQNESPRHDSGRYQPNPQSRKMRSRENSYRESSFYPHVMRRKTPKKSLHDLSSPGKPLLAADVIAQRLRTPESTPDTSPMQSSPIAAARRPSSAGGSGKERRKFYDRFRSPRRRSSTKSHSPVGTDQDYTTIASPSSPHLFPSPVKTNTTSATTTPTHPGWSDASRRTFDEPRSPPSTPDFGGSPSPLVTHIISPARTSDATSKDVPSPELISSSPPTSGAGSGGPGKPSLFGSVLDGWRQNKAQKRREDLKKLIRVVPVADGDGAEEENGGMRRSSLESVAAGGGGDGVGERFAVRRGSTGGWM